jgi:hypothetical protein
MRFRIDSLFHVCSYFQAMTRLDESALSIHLEVALAGAAPELLGDLVHPDRSRRAVAAGDVARHLAGRLRCFDVCYSETGARLEAQPSLFPDDLGPIA